MRLLIDFTKEKKDSMKIIELDISNCYNLYELHERIRQAFNFSEWYGNNWDAFWDMMRSECDVDKVIIKGEHTMPKEFSEELAIMHEVLDRTIEYNERIGYPPFSYEVID